LPFVEKIKGEVLKYVVVEAPGIPRMKIGNIASCGSDVANGCVWFFSFFHEVVSKYL